MILKKGTFPEFAEHVKRTKTPVIVYGAGVIGQTAAPYWLHACQLDRDVLCYVDADPRKQGQYVELSDRRVPVRSLDTLAEIGGEAVLLITVSAFDQVVRALEEIEALQNTAAYFLPVMLLDMAHTSKAAAVVRAGQEQLIPKKIHYCWFSGKPVPEPLRRCMETWRRFCPDYEIIRWDESNYDVEKTLYMKQAYAHQQWSFVSDAARLDILYQHGGIYLDTDVEMVQNFDELLYQPGFCSMEKWGFVNTGSGIGACPQHPLIKAVWDYRKDIPFVFEDGTLNLTTCGYYETRPLLAHGLKPNGETQVIGGGKLTVYASEFFHPFDYMSGETRITKNTFSIHHFSGTWLGPEAAGERAKTRRRFREFRNRLI